ncbi:MAG TPA: Holliday junction branch migration DNA helicase RuvB [Armatimonadota bacterium]|jgi:Holliday junction DNA helicase RuvB
MHERIISGHETLEDATTNYALRPDTLTDYIGQPQIKENLATSIQAARGREEPLDHVLLYGPPGLGKTTLAHIIATEMGAELVTTSGPAMERAGDLVGILTNLQPGAVLFIDEIHRLPRVVEEYLYSAMEDYSVDFMIDKGAFAKSIKLPVSRFTLVGATTRAGKLTAPLRERFGIFYHLEFYPDDELVKIVNRSAGILHVPTEPDGAIEIARRSRGTPRIANRLLRRVRDYAEVKGTGVIDRAIADQALCAQGVDHRGLDDLDRKLLRTIIDFYQGGPVGVEALAATLNEESDTLVDMVEPFLLKIGFLSRTPSGRKATALTYQHFNLQPSHNIMPGQSGLFDPT